MAERGLDFRTSRAGPLWHVSDRATLRSRGACQPSDPNPPGCHAVVRAQTRTEIARPLETVFGFVVHEFFDNYPRWSPEVIELEALDARPLAVGRRVRQVRVDRGRRSETIVRVTALDAPRRVELASEHAPWYRIRFDFAPAGTDATELAFSFELTRLELYMRPFAKLIRRAVDEGARRSVEDLRRLVEAER